MAFGSKITDLEQAGVGTNGYLVRINTTPILAEDVKMVQVQASPTELPTPYDTEMSASALKALPESTDTVPDVAFNYSQTECLVFLKSSVFPYVDATRIALDGYRTIQAAVNVTDLIDVANKDIPLLTSLALRNMYRNRGSSIPQSIQESIEQQFKEIDDEV